MKLILMLIFSFFLKESFAQKTVKISGIAPMLKNGTILILTQLNPVNSSESITPYELSVKSGKFSKTITTGNGDRFQLILNEKYVKDIFLEPGKILIEIPDTTLEMMVVSNNKSAVQNYIYLNQLAKLPSSINYRSASSKYIASTTENIDSLGRMKFINDSLQKIYVADRVKLSIATITDNPNSLINASLLADIANEIPQDKVISLFKLLNAKAKNNAYGRYLRFNIDSLFIGSTAPHFIQNDTSGKKINLIDFRGKFVLLDFWASWCIPCRADNPYLVAAMQKYKGRNFTIVSISLDSDRAKWINAIQKDGLNWTQISDLKDWSNDVARKYRITAIPDNFILDPNGKIIARRVPGKGLIEFLDAHTE